MAIIKKIPASAHYLYTTEDNLSLCKVYKAKSRIYLDVICDSGHIIYSYTPLEIEQLSIKLTKYAKEVSQESVKAG